MNIGQRIKERRTELEMSLEQLACKLGVNKSTVYRYETGAIEKMPISSIKPIAEALHTTPAHLLGWDQDEINDISEIQHDAAEYTESEEYILKDFMLEIADMGFSNDEIEIIRKYAHAVKQAETSVKELQLAFIDLFIKMYEIGLTIEDLNDIYTYAQFIQSKK